MEYAISTSRFFICSANAYLDSNIEGDTNTGVRREGQALTFMQRICEKKSVSFNIRHFVWANKTFYSVCRMQKLATPKMLSRGARSSPQTNHFRKLLPILVKVKVWFLWTEVVGQKYGSTLGQSRGPEDATSTENS